MTQPPPSHPAPGDEVPKNATPSSEAPVSDEAKTSGPLTKGAAPDADARLWLEQRTGKGALFFQIMFGLLLVAAARSFALKSHWLDRLPPLMLGLIGLGALVSITLLRRDVVVGVSLGADALGLRRRSGAEETRPLTQVIGIRRDIGQDMELAYLVVFEGDRLLRLRPPKRDDTASLQQFVDGLAQRAGLAWDGPNAVPPSPPSTPSP